MDKRLKDLAIKTLGEEIERRISQLSRELQQVDEGHYTRWLTRANLSRGTSTKTFIEYYIKHLQDKVKEITDLEQAQQGLKEETDV